MGKGRKLSKGGHQTKSCGGFHVLQPLGPHPTGALTVHHSSELSQLEERSQKFYTSVPASHRSRGLPTLGAGRKGFPAARLGL